MHFSRQVLTIDAAAESERIVYGLRNTVRTMKRQGAVVGISGGVDSSVVMALCARAFGPSKVIALMLPEKDSDPLSAELAKLAAGRLGITPQTEVITPVLDGFGCYARRDAAIRRVFPEFDAKLGYKAKIVLPDKLLDEDTLNIFSLVVITPDGGELRQTLQIGDFLQIVAASNFKQRTRMAMLYYHAELNNYAVIGTANRNEHEQGFFVKYGDSGVDVKAIGHLYKTQVYQLAEYLDIPEEIRRRTPTSDTYSAPGTQEEFFFRLPFELMDLLAYALEHDVDAEEAARVLGLRPIQVQRAYADLSRKRRTTDYLRMPPQELALP